MGLRGGVGPWVARKASQGCGVEDEAEEGVRAREGAVAARQNSWIVCECVQRHSMCRRRHIFFSIAARVSPFLVFIFEIFAGKAEAWVG